MVSEPINSSLFHQLAEQLQQQNLEQIQKQLLEHQQKVVAAATSHKCVSSKDSALELVLELHINDGLPVPRLNPTLAPGAEETAKSSLRAKYHYLAAEGSHLLLLLASYCSVPRSIFVCQGDPCVGLRCSCFFCFSGN